MFTLFMTAAPFAVAVGLVIVAWVLLDGVAETVRKPSELELRFVATRLGYEGVDGLYRGRRVELFARAGGKAGARICGGPKFLTLEKRRGLASTPGVVTRDAVFDTDFRLDGPASQVLALMSEGMRARIGRAWIARSVALEHGALVLENLTDTSEAESAIRASVLLLEDLEQSAGEDVVPALARLATSDGNSGTRREALTILSREFADREETSLARQAARYDSDPDVRRTALGEVGGALALAEQGTEGQLSSAPQTGALSPTRSKKEALRGG